MDDLLEELRAKAFDLNIEWKDVSFKAMEAASQELKLRKELSALYDRIHDLHTVSQSIKAVQEA